MNTIQRNPSPPLSNLFMILLLILACLVALSFASIQSAGKDYKLMPASVWSDVT